MGKGLNYYLTHLIVLGILTLPALAFSQELLGPPPIASAPPSATSPAAILLPDVPASSPLLATSTTTKTTTMAPGNMPPNVGSSFGPPGSPPINMAPPPANVTSSLPPNGPSKADEAQFQNWLKQNRQQTNPQLPPGNRTGSSSRPRPKTIIHVPHGPDAPAVVSVPLTLEESQQIMLESAPPSEPPSDESTAAFNAMMKQNVPLSPQQVVRLRQVVDTSQRAAAIPATVPPKPVSSTVIVNLAPGATPPAIRVAQGYISSLVFVDSAGAPWPIAAYDIGDPKATTIQWDGKSNILLIQAATPYSDSNLVVRLTGLPTPVTLELVSSQRVVDYRTDIHVPGIGPNTKDLPTGTELPNSANQLLLNVLDGIAPSGSKLLTVMGGDCQAWLLGDKMYLRTRLTVLSPGWIGKMASPDGMNAYEIQRTSSVLVSQHGEPIELKIGGF